MAGELMTLPLRIGARGAGLLLRVTQGIAEHAFAVPARVVGALRPEHANAAPETPRTATEAAASSGANASAPSSTRSPQAPPSEAAGPTAIASFPAEPAAPTHISEEPELVEEVAEIGAEDGAGAQITVDEPWEGYERMTAKEVIGRLRDAGLAQLAAVKLYESAHRGRQTVLTAVDRGLKSASGSGSPN